MERNSGSDTRASRGKGEEVSHRVETPGCRSRKRACRMAALAEERGLFSSVMETLEGVGQGPACSHLSSEGCHHPVSLPHMASLAAASLSSTLTHRSAPASEGPQVDARLGRVSLPTSQMQTSPLWTSIKERLGHSAF